MRAKQRLYVTANKKKVVLGAPFAAYLFKAKGQEITKAELEKYPELKNLCSGLPERDGVSENEKILKVAPDNKMKKPVKNK